MGDGENLMIKIITLKLSFREDIEIWLIYEILRISDELQLICFMTKELYSFVGLLECCNNCNPRACFLRFCVTALCPVHFGLAFR